jgi:carboxyl-terminal processing protease
MRRSRIVLLAASCLIVSLLAGGSLALRVGAADGAYGDVILFSELLSLIADNYVDPVDTSGLLEDAYAGMLGNLDANGAFLTPDEVARWKARGAEGTADPGFTVIKAHGSFVVVFVAPESPAADAELSRGDQIRKIEGRSSRGLSLAQARRLLRGEPGTVVSVEVLHPDAGWSREALELSRSVPSYLPYELSVRDGIGLLTVRDLRRLDAATLAEELDDVRSRGVDRLMLDLRDVSEGDPRDAVGLVELFGPDLELRLRNRSGELLETVKGSADRAAWEGTLATLVNGATAGGSEAVAMLLQSGLSAKVYGEMTYGLGSEPGLFELEDGSGLVFSTALWETASGASWNDEGVQPDETVQGERAEDEVADNQLERALEAFAEAGAEETVREAA